ncbi:response regulator [Maribacter chungangensis]|uniref:Response regulator n=1 Tax=Maribacter chungangensis TaxID=1069117 RepID=A0ABW3B8K7_9FLAO
MNKIKNCCIIDDDPIFIYGTKRMMKETNFCDSITVFNNGEDALLGLTEMLQVTHELPQVIFLDLNMPIMNGWEFLDEFIKLPNNSLNKTVIYVISSSVDPRDIEKVKEYELISNYILKPITPNDFETILNSQLVQ